jgi:hypothetical protein
MRSERVETKEEKSKGDSLPFSKLERDNLNGYRVRSCQRFFLLPSPVILQVMALALLHQL